MTATTIYTGAGLDSIQISKRSSAGYATGIAGLTSASTNTYSEAYRLIGANAAEITVNDRTRVSIQGDDTAIAQFTFGPTDLPSFGLTMSAEDFTLANTITGLSNLTLGSAIVNAGVPNEIVPEPLVIMASRQAQSLASATSGDAQWVHKVILNGQISPVNDSYTFQGGASFTHTITATNAKRTAWGQLISSAFTGIVSNSILTITSENRLTFGAFVGNNAATTFAVTQLPVGATYAKAFVESGSGTNSFSAATISSITTNTVTLSAAPASGAFVIIFFEFDEWA